MGGRAAIGQDERTARSMAAKQHAPPAAGAAVRGAILPRLDAQKLNRHLPRCQAIRIEINGILAGAPAALPDAVSEFAIGWAFLQRFFLTADQVTRVSATGSRVSLMVDGGVDLDRARYEAIGWIPRLDAQDAGAGDRSSRRPRAVPVMSELDAISTSRTTFARFEEDGARAGYRHAALATADDVLCIARDLVGDVAAAKVLGWALPNAVDRSASMLVVRGILDEPLVTGAARAGIPIVATDAVPTVAAIAAADAMCISILGLALSHRRGLFADGGHLANDASTLAQPCGIDAFESGA